MSKKIFIITGESSGDKIASLVIKKIKEKNSNVIFSAVGGEYIKSENVSCIFDIKDIAFMGFVDVVRNIFSIQRKINLTVKKIIEFNPDIIFSIDSPDFSFRILKKIKKLNSKIKTLHLVAPQVWAWRENRKIIINKFVDHLLLLFPFESKYFDGFVRNSFVGHPFFDASLFDLNKSEENNMKYLTLCPGSRNSEIKTFMPIFLELINKINIDNNFIFHFPSVSSKKKLINDFFLESGINNYVITTTEEEKNFYIRNSILAISKSGTITLDICKNKCPLIVIYKTSFINFLLIKPFINTKFGNILNIIANKEIIPELIQNNCNIDSIYEKAHEFINDEALRKKQVTKYTEALKLIIVKDSLDKISNYVLE